MVPLALMGYLPKWGSNSPPTLHSPCLSRRVPWLPLVSNLPLLPRVCPIPSRKAHENRSPTAWKPRGPSAFPSRAGQWDDRIGSCQAAAGTARGLRAKIVQVRERVKPCRLPSHLSKGRSRMPWVGNVMGSAGRQDVRGEGGRRGTKKTATPLHFPPSRPLSSSFLSRPTKSVCLDRGELFQPQPQPFFFFYFFFPIQVIQVAHL